MSKKPIPNLEAANFVGKHSVAFLLADQGAPGGVNLKASGSLVTFDHRYFILTATHVWAALRQSPTIHCSAIADISHDFNLPREALTPYSLDDNLDKELGAGKELKEFDADLTLLELLPVDYRKMEIRSSFFPLEREPDAGMNDWAIIGAPGVLAHRDAREINTLSFEIRAIFIDNLTQETEHNGMDFLRGLPYQDPSSPIQDYRGMSGGGLWSLTIAANIAETSILKIPACFPDSVVGFIPDEGKADARFIKYYIDTIKLRMQNVSSFYVRDESRIRPSLRLATIPDR